MFKVMKILIKATKLDLTSALKSYLEEKIWSLNKLVDKWDLEGAVVARVELGRTTVHHHKGDVFRAEINLNLPGQVLRVEAEEWDIRVAIDRVKNELQREIKKYNALHDPS